MARPAPLADSLSVAVPAPAQAPAGDVTQLLHAFANGHRDAFDQLVPLIYAELTRVARDRLRRERPGHTLDTGALVHEAWDRLRHQVRTVWRSREHFLAVASEAMRRILVDHAKARAAQRRGGAQRHVSLDEIGGIADPSTLTDAQADLLLALDEALSRLATFNAAGAQVVQYRYFGGLSNPEIATLMDTSERSVRRLWIMAKAWLQRELAPERPVAHDAPD
ncbi:MAG: sigma-70 family RNA polymerase sigma factor [Gemmatimonadetes bacterium]|nr:sigma-70 family RNA polymerase sigma factor [Gemmatimonadota bacterium]